MTIPFGFVYKYVYFSGFVYKHVYFFPFKKMLKK